MSGCSFNFKIGTANPTVWRKYYLLLIIIFQPPFSVHFGNLFLGKIWLADFVGLWGHALSLIILTYLDQLILAYFGCPKVGSFRG